MKLRHGAALALMGLALVGQAKAQQPTAIPPARSGWCSDVPAIPPPPYFEQANGKGSWARRRKMCLEAAAGPYSILTTTCMHICLGASELWQRAKAGQIRKPTN